MGILRYFLGLKVAYYPEGLLLTQQKYICNILSLAALADNKLVPTPWEVNAKLGILDRMHSLTQCAIDQPVALFTSPLLAQILHFSVNTVSQIIVGPTKIQWVAILRIFRYLRHTITRSSPQVASHSQPIPSRIGLETPMIVGPPLASVYSLVAPLSPRKVINNLWSPTSQLMLNIMP